MSITHTKVSTVPDGSDTTQVQPSDWNNTHTVNLPLIVGGSSVASPGIPGADNPFTEPNTLRISDGDTTNPQSSNANPSAVFQRVSSAQNISNAFIFHATSTAAAAPDIGPIALTAVISDQTIARGGTASRAIAYCDAPPAISALVSATISGASIIVVTSTAHRAILGSAVYITGSVGITGLNSGPYVITQLDSTTQFRIAKGALTGGPASGGSVIVAVAYYSRWSSTWKVNGPKIRVVGEESDFNNQYGDAGNDVTDQDATFNYAIYASYNKCTTGVYLDSGDGGTGQYYFPLKFGANCVVANYPHIDTSSRTNAVVTDFAWIGNGQVIRWADNTVQGNTVAGKWPILELDTANNFHISAPTGQGIYIGPNLTNKLVITTKVSAKADVTLVKAPNYIASETGANNAIVGALTDSDATAVPLAAGLEVIVKLGHTLQAGANTFNFNAGGVVNIKSSRNSANNIATAYAASGVIKLLYDGTSWLDMSQ